MCKYPGVVLLLSHTLGWAVIQTAQIIPWEWQMPAGPTHWWEGLGKGALGQPCCSAVQ